MLADGLLTWPVWPNDDRIMSFEVEFRNVGGDAAAIGSAGPYTLVVDRPADAGGRGLGFNGGQLLYLAIGGCVSNDLFREAQSRGIGLRTVQVVVRGDFSGEPPVSEDITYEVEIAGEATHEQLEELISHVDAIAEIPNSVRRGTQVKLTGARIISA
jgi:putative redox protein